MPLPKGPIHGAPVVDLSSPYNLQAVVAKRDIALSWDWQPPDQEPLFTAFGFEVKRSDGKTTVVAERSFSDFDLAFGSYTYLVRVRAEAKERGRRVTHVSDWSEPASGVIRTACTDAPQITLNAQTTQKAYASIPSLRMHLVGDVQAPAECHVSQVQYHLDTGTGITHSGALTLDANGHYDTFINAIGPDDEIPSGTAQFTVTATAEDEAGPNTSAAYTIGIELQNPYAPR